MDSSDKKPRESGGSYGYSYGSGGYAGYSAVGYGYGGEGEPGGQMKRTLQDYLLILRERIWYIVVVFLVVFSSSLVYTLSETKIYQAQSLVQVMRSPIDITKLGSPSMDADKLTGAEDVNTQMKLMESGAIVQRVAARITGDDLRAFLAPYVERAVPDEVFVIETLTKNRKVIPQRLTLVVVISYQHPDPVVAAKVANLFAEEYIADNLDRRTGVQAGAVDTLRGAVDEQQKIVERMARELHDYKVKHNMPALDERRDIVTESLRLQNAETAKAQSALTEAEGRLNQVKALRAKNGDLTELSFIANPLITELSQQLSKNKIAMAELSKRYREKHPAMIRAVNQLQTNETELKRAVDTAAAQIESAYEAARRSYEQAEAEMKKRREDSLALDRLSLEYTDKERALKTAEKLLETIATRRSETSMTSEIKAENARIVDRAVPPRANKPIFPNVPLNIGLGVVGGLGLGLAFAFFVAYIDDRVKSSFDIEGVIGLPLIGIIPQIKRMEQPDKAQIVASNADRQVSEAFLTLHSSLRLKDESKNAKCILVTSTIPGEGKSFTTTNLALTFAAHGEKVVVIDCDLRKPNVHKSFRIENLKGVIDICNGSAKIDDVVVRNVHPNLDVIPAGGRAKNPTQVLNSKAFELMLSDLRKTYDRVFIDTPPLAAVSDAMVVLPLVDGSIFTIFFNKVRRKAAQFAAKKLLEANVPNFGAVLNGLNLAVSGYYYAQYYDKSYKDYYVVMSKNDDSGDKEK